jgi:hypothetical protein
VLSEQVEALTCEDAGADANAELQASARLIAEAQICAASAKRDIN